MKRRDFIKMGAAASAGALLPNLSANEGGIPDGKALWVHNAKVLTVDGKNRVAEAFVVENGRFSFVGSNADVRLKRPEGAVEIDARGATIIPGLNDSHTHFIRGGMQYALELRWDGVSSVEEALELLRLQSLRTPKGQWIRVVGGYSIEQFKEKRLPSLEEINQVAPNHPVYVLYLYARGMLNRKAVEIVGYDTVNVGVYPGGKVVKDRHGRATGMLIADPSGLILYKTLAHAPTLGRSDMLLSSRHYQRELNSLGITSVADAGGGGMYYPDAYSVIHELNDSNLQTVRCGYSTFPQIKGEEHDRYRAWTRKLKAGQGDGMLRFVGAGENLCWASYDYEIFAMPRPDVDEDAEERLEGILKTVHSAGWPSRHHMTYNETLDRLLPVYEKVSHELGGLSSNWFIDHCETITEKNMERIARLGGGIAVQNRIAYQAEDFLSQYGAAELAQTPPIRKMLKMGIPVGGGTDSTRVVSYNPWLSLEWLVTGKSLGGLQMYGDENVLDRLDALRIWTKGSAWFTSEQESKGAIARGEYADFAVLDRDFLTTPDRKIRNTQSRLTAVGGKIVHASENYAHLAPRLPDLKPDWSPVNAFGGYHRLGV